MEAISWMGCGTTITVNSSSVQTGSRSRAKKSRHAWKHNTTASGTGRVTSKVYRDARFSSLLALLGFFVGLRHHAAFPGFHAVAPVFNELDEAPRQLLNAIGLPAANRFGGNQLGPHANRGCSGDDIRGCRFLI